MMNHFSLPIYHFYFYRNYDTYIIYILWSGDDEIESASNILFDSNIKHYFNAEDIAVIGDIPFMRIYEELDNL